MAGLGQAGHPHGVIRGSALGGAMPGYARAMCAALPAGHGAV